jgi:hypothetical protein
MDDVTINSSTRIVIDDPGTYGIESILSKKHGFESSDPILRGALVRDAQGGHTYFITDEDLVRYERAASGS